MGLGPLLVLCGACFAASALLEWQIRIPGDRPQPRTQRKPDFAADLRESLTYLYHSRPELLRLAGIMALVNLVEIPAVVVGIPVVIVQYLGQSDVVLGAVQAVLSVGGLGRRSAGQAAADTDCPTGRPWDFCWALPGCAPPWVLRSGYHRLPAAGWPCAALG